MKKASILILTGFCLLTVHQSFAQILYSDILHKTTLKTTPQHQHTNIEWNNTKHDFGHLQQGEAMTHEFQFTNTSAEPVVIYNVHTNGTCIRPLWANKAIQPNESATIKITFCAQHTGAFQNIIKVQIRNTEQAEVLYIEGVVS